MKHSREASLGRNFWNFFKNLRVLEYFKFLSNAPPSNVARPGVTYFLLHPPLLLGLVDSNTHCTCTCTMCGSKNTHKQIALFTYSSTFFHSIRDYFFKKLAITVCQFCRQFFNRCCKFRTKLLHRSEDNEIFVNEPFLLSHTVYHHNH